MYGVAARDAELRAKAAAEQRCKTYEDMNSALADPAVDLIVLATPHDTHAPLAIAALGAGKHVVTDKVMCLSLAECDAMIAAATKAQKLLTVFHNRRWDGVFLTLRQAIADGRLGDVRWIEMAWQKPGAWRKWRASRERGGGRLRDLGAHLLDQLLLLFPSPVSGVFCRMHTDLSESDVESHAMATLTFDGGFTGICDVGPLALAPKPRIYAVGPDATLVKYGVDPQEAAMFAGDIDAAKEDEKNFARLHTADGEEIIPTLPGRWRTFYDNVAATLTGEAEPLVKLAEMRRLIAVIDACFESARTNSVVRPQIE